jgi:hypothetical protein
MSNGVHRSEKRALRVQSFWDAGFTGTEDESESQFPTWRKTQDWLERRGYPDLSDCGVLQRIYDSEINVDIRFSPDSSFGPSSAMT